MYNYVMLIGLLDGDLKKIPGTELYAGKMTVRRDFRNLDGSYDSDVFNVRIPQFIATAAKNVLKGKGRNVCLKGRLRVEDNAVVVVAERVFVTGSYNPLDSGWKDDWDWEE